MRIVLTLIGILAATFQLFGQSAENILLVANEASPVSLELSQYYAEKRGVPKEQILRIRTATTETVDRATCELQIEGPIAGWIARNSAHDRILYIVLTKGVPLRVAGTGGENGTVASVDSELALLYRKMAGQRITPSGRVANPYFLADAALSQAKRFTHDQMDIFLVTRLDGYTPEDIRELIDRGLSPVRQGKVILDGKGSSQDKGDRWLKAAAEVLQKNDFGDRVLLDSTPRVMTGIEAVLGYYSWGSNDPANRLRRANMRFVPGALAAMFVSSDARTFQEPPADWKIGTWEDKASHFAGSPQSLTGDLVRDGVTGVAGHVAEPFLEATVRPNVLFPAYLGGHNLAESYYLAMPFLSWQTVVVGDPLCAPFRTKPLSSAEIDPGIDDTTELPQFFSARRLRNASVAAFRQAKVLPETIRLLLRAEVRLAKQDRAEARKLLEEATSRESRLSSAQLILASIYEQDREYDKAIERYRLLVNLSPDNPVVLNNLAYALAVHRNLLKEALPLAEKAYGLAKGVPNIADTLGWIHHLLNDDATAMVYIGEALKSGARNPSIQLHAAIVYAALGKDEEAALALSAALSIDPKLEDQEDVKSLRAKLASPKQ